MNKRVLGLLAFAAMFSGGGFGPLAGAINAQATLENAKARQAGLDAPQHNEEFPQAPSRRILSPSYLPPIRTRYDHSMSKKEYGQYLQATGQQKWTKKGGKA